MGNIKLSGRYAKSLLDLAKEKGAVDAVFNDAQLFNEAARDREFTLMIRSPIVSSDKKLKVMEGVFGNKVNPITAAFFRLVILKGREFYLDDIMNTFIELYNELNEISHVKFTSAAPVSDATLEKVKSIIRQNSTIKTVHLTNKVNEDLIGAFVLEFKDKLFDASIAHDLKAMKKQFLENDYVKKF